MKRTTRKLSSHAKDRFFERFYAAEPGLEQELAQRLVVRSKATFTSVRIRKVVWALAGSARKPRGRPAVAAPVVPAAPAPAAFDPYQIGLVPVFQREGRDGLLASLAAIERVDHLRLMAKTQQIVLPESLRRGDAEASVLRHAIADAVARRIADRRAAAG